MSIKDDGGPAFPVPEFSGGMSLRDYFASKFMDRAQILCVDRDGGWDFNNAAACAYQMADAMITERAK